MFGRDKKKDPESDHPGYGHGTLEQAVDGDGRSYRWLIVAVGVFVVFLVGGAFAAYAYDDSRNDEIANGITVNGVDIGGLDDEEATRLLRHQLLQPLRKSVKVTYDGERWVLPAKKLKVRADINGAVEEALDASREGGLPSRIVRYISDGTVDESISVDVAYSQPAINRFVRRLAGDIDREAQDASVSPSAASLDVVPGTPGREIRDNLLEEKLAAVVSGNEMARTIRAKVRVTKPEVTTKEVAAAYPTYITVDQSSYTARVWKDLKLAREYTIAIGQPGYPTPYGLYSIASKAVDPVWSVPNSPWAGELAGTTVAGGTAENPLKARWMGIVDGVGFHGTDQTYSLGTAASHGCLRMAVDDIVEMYDMVPIGTPVYIG
jgi:lipoprotein-anchoring transpeptidase ErfK/SrfK